MINLKADKEPVIETNFVTEFEKPNIECQEINEITNYAKFICEPLERGYGVTLGNSLRRILLSSLPGCALTSVKIDGVLHEFSTVQDVVEDVPEIIVNLKNVRLKFAENEEKYMRIDVKNTTDEPYIVTARDIVTDGSVAILNRDLHIATLSQGGKLTMELIANRGRGYNSAEQNKKLDQDISFLPIDSIYTPVKKVNYQVENTRVGQMVDFDKLVLEVWTDGSIESHEAISLAAKVMSGHLDLFIDLSDAVRNTAIMIEKEENKIEKVLETSIEELQLSARAYHALKNASVSTVEELIAKTSNEVEQIRNLGKKSFEEIKMKLHELGLEFASEVD